MRSPLIMVCVWSAAVLAGEGGAAASEQCLSTAELGNVGRMAAVMALGVAVQRCGQCLGPQSSEMVHAYETSGWMQDFWNAQKALEPQKEKLDYIDQLTRDSARNFAADLTADCDACRRTAATVKRLASASSRSEFYGSETDAIARAPGVKACP